MRINHFTDKVKKLDKLLILNTSVVSGHETELIKINNIEEYNLALFELWDLKIFNHQIQKIRFALKYGNEDLFDKQSFRDLSDANQELKNELSTSYSTLELFRTDDDDPTNGICIKLPEVTDFDDLSKVSSTLQKVLSQTILNAEINGVIKIIGVDKGSIWILVLVGTTSAVSLIAGLAWSAAVIYKKVQEGRILESKVKDLNIRNESLEDIKIANKKMLELLVKSEAEFVAAQNFKNPNPDLVERLKHSIKLLSGLIDKGGEIHPTLSAPENVKNLFPNYKNPLLIESKMKKLDTGDSA